MAIRSPTRNSFWWEVAHLRNGSQHSLLGKPCTLKEAEDLKHGLEEKVIGDNMLHFVRTKKQKFCHSPAARAWVNEGAQRLIQNHDVHSLQLKTSRKRQEGEKEESHGQVAGEKLLENAYRSGFLRYLSQGNISLKVMWEANGKEKIKSNGAGWRDLTQLSSPMAPPLGCWEKCEAPGNVTSGKAHWHRKTSVCDKYPPRSPLPICPPPTVSLSFLLPHFPIASPDRRDCETQFRFSSVHEWKWCV